MTKIKVLCLLMVCVLQDASELLPNRDNLALYSLTQRYSQKRANKQSFLHCLIFIYCIQAFHIFFI